jgi:hypothetical protein
MSNIDRFANERERHCLGAAPCSGVEHALGVLGVVGVDPIATNPFSQ